MVYSNWESFVRFPLKFPTGKPRFFYLWLEYFVAFEITKKIKNVTFEVFQMQTSIFSISYITSLVLKWFRLTEWINKARVELTEVGTSCWGSLWHFEPLFYRPPSWSLLKYLSPNRVMNTNWCINGCINFTLCSVCSLPFFYTVVNPMSIPWYSPCMLISILVCFQEYSNCNTPFISNSHNVPLS